MTNVQARSEENALLSELPIETVHLIDVYFNDTHFHRPTINVTLTECTF